MQCARTLNHLATKTILSIITLLVGLLSSSLVQASSLDQLIDLY